MTKLNLFLICGLTCILSALSGCHAGRGADTELSSEAAGQAGENADSASVDQTAFSDAGIPTDITPAALFAARNPYIGDAVSDGKLIQMLKAYYEIPESYTMELQTVMPPYGLILHFKEEPDNASMQKAAAVFMAMTDNCAYVSWDYPLDESGNRDWMYLPANSVPAFEGSGLYGKDEAYRESEEGLKELLSKLESIEKPYPALPRVVSVEEAVSAAVLEYNRNLFLEAEVFGEGHVILDTEEEDGENRDTEASRLTVYAQVIYGGYTFANGRFVCTSGSGMEPAAITLSKEPDGSFVPIHLQMPIDGGDYTDSIHELFPEALWEACISPSEEVKAELTRQKEAYAADYLKTIGREEAEIGEYGDFPHTTLTEAGVSVEISNKLLNLKKEGKSPSAYAPDEPGNIERLEDGVRYLYETTCDPEIKEVVYSKLRCDTGEVMERQIFDTETGKLKSELP